MHNSYFIIHNSGKAKGFTLIELLVVVSIIGILTTLLFANLNTARERGRDAQRKSDVRNMQTALRLYYNDKGVFPAGSSTNGYKIMGCGSSGTTACDWGSEWSVGSTVYMSRLPIDPQDQPGTTTSDYRYVSSDGDDYLLAACLENKSDDKGQTPEDPSWCPSRWMYLVKP